MAVRGTGVKRTGGGAKNIIAALGFRRRGQHRREPEVAGVAAKRRAHGRAGACRIDNGSESRLLKCVLPASIPINSHQMPETSEGVFDAEQRTEKEFQLRLMQQIHLARKRVPKPQRASLGGLVEVPDAQDLGKRLPAIARRYLAESDVGVVENTGD